MIGIRVSGLGIRDDLSRLIRVLRIPNSETRTPRQ
jgi:hypothetical protein